MVYHVVLFSPRENLSLIDQRALAEALARATREIPTVRDVRVGRRVRHGAGYEARNPVDFPFVALIAFDDLAGLHAYLEHPAHEALGARFADSLAAALVFDYDVAGIDALQGWFSV